MPKTNEKPVVTYVDPARKAKLSSLCHVLDYSQSELVGLLIDGAYTRVNKVLMELRKDPEGFLNSGNESAK